MIEIICKQCGEKFKVPPSRKNTAKYCSYKCAGKYKTGKKVSSYKEKIILICKECNKKFEVLPCFKDKIFCSNKCQGKWQSKTMFGIDNPSWNGGMKVSKRRSKNKRRNYLNLNSIELNKFFKDAEAHHIDDTYIIFLPHKLHNSYHNQQTGQNMFKINKLAFKYLYEHQEDMLISIEEAFKINLNNKWNDINDK